MGLVEQKLNVAGEESMKGWEGQDGQIVEDLACVVKDFTLHPKGVAIILGTPAW